MPIKIPDHLPAVDVLHRENIFVMTQGRAVSQDIRPLQILLVNLMPKKIQTEVQFSRLLGNTSLQIELELIAPKTHESANTPPEHLQAFYKTFDDAAVEIPVLHIIEGLIKRLQMLRRCVDGFVGLRGDQL